MASKRLRSYLDALCVLICEILGLALFLGAGSLLGTIDFAHFGGWLRSTSPEDALTALLRLLGIVVCGWLLASTLLYGAGRLSGKRAVTAKARFITLPALQRVVDSLAAASVAVSSIGAVGPVAGAAPVPRPAPVVRPHLEPSQVGGDRARPAPVPSVPVHVSSTALERHFPHPGRARHALPEPKAVVERRVEVPSEENGFAGLPRGTKVVVVQPGDCLSVLAERHLGDWRLDSEIEGLNYGRIQPDGRALVDDHWIYAGWVLVMPSDAVGAQVVGGGMTSSPPEAPPIRHVPEGAPVRRQPEPHAASSSSSTASPERATTTTTPAAASADSAPTVTSAGTTAPATQPQGAPHAPAAGIVATTGPRHRVRAEDGNIADLILAAGVGAIVGGGIVWRLDRSRREIGHLRPKGRDIARNEPEVEAAESRARAIARTDAVRWVDCGLRYLSGLVEQMSLDGVVPAPALALVRVGPRGLEVIFSARVKGSVGWFSPSEDGTAHVLDSEVTLEELELLAADRWPVWPALVSIGESRQGLLLLNLEHAGSVSVEGAERSVQALLTRMALELTSQPWSDEMLAGLYALGDGCLDGLSGAQGVPSHKAMDLAEKLDLVSAAQQDLAGRFSLSTLRAVACEALPNVAVAFAGAPADAVRCLAEAAVPQQSGIAVAAAGPYPGARWKLVLDDAGQGSLEGQLSEGVVSFDVKTDCDPVEVALLGEALANASELGGRAVSGDSDRIAPDEPVDIQANGGHAETAPAASVSSHVKLPEPERGEVEICVLGPVDVAGGDIGALEPSRRMAALALLAYLASHERPVTADEMASALWPLDATKDNVAGPQRKTVMNLISRARTALGYNTAGKERLVYSPLGYRLSADVTSDWARFEKYLGNARRQEGVESIASLRKALDLVRGEPFSGALSSQFFEWVASEHLDLTFAARAVDAAEDLGQLALNSGDLGTVLWAVEKGLQLEPTREEMFRLWMHALGREGRPAKVDEVYRRLQMVLRQRIHPLQEPQPESREVWRRYTGAELSRTQA